MKTIKQVSVTPFFCGNHMLPFHLMEDGIIYISEKYNTSTHRCLCGCGEKTVLPLNHNGSTFGWNLIKHDDGKISFTPSIGNYNLPCKSHYIITKNVANFV